MPWTFLVKIRWTIQWRRTMKKKSVLMAGDHKGVMAHNSFGGANFGFRLWNRAIRDCAISYRLVTLSPSTTTTPLFFFFHPVHLQGFPAMPIHTIAGLSAIWFGSLELTVNRPWVVIVMVSSLKVPNPTGSLHILRHKIRCSSILHGKLMWCLCMHSF